MTTASLTVAKLVLREVLRRRLLLALLALTLLTIALTTWGFSRIPTLTQRGVPLAETQVRLIASQFLILVMFMFSNVVGLSAVFAAAPALSGDVETGTALSVLSRPISRADYVVGKWLGFAAVVFGYTFGAATLELLAVNAVVGYLPPRPLEFMLFVFAEGCVLLSFALLLSSRLSGMVGGVVALALFGMAWIGGVVGGIGSVFDNSVLENIGTASALILPTDGLWRGAIWSLEPAAVIAGTAVASPASAANPFYAAAPPPWPYLAWTVAWIAGVLGAAVASFSAREV